MRPVCLAVIAATSIFLAGPASSFDLECSEFRPLISNDELKRPGAPYCATMGMNFIDESDFAQCKYEMDTYRRKMQSYQRCLSSEADQAVDEYNKAVQSFNQRASF